MSFMSIKSSHIYEIYETLQNDNQKRASLRGQIFCSVSVFQLCSLFCWTCCLFSGKSKYFSVSVNTKTHHGDKTNYYIIYRHKPSKCRTLEEEYSTIVQEKLHVLTPML